jgi:hypothetical protein
MFFHYPITLHTVHLFPLKQQKVCIIVLVLCGSCALTGTILAYYLDNCETPSSLSNEMEETSSLLQTMEEDPPMWMQFFSLFFCSTKSWLFGE